MDKAIHNETGSPLPFTLVDTGPGTAAWRAVERDAPGLFALISNGEGTAPPIAPETDDITIALFDEGVEETLGSVVIDGRAGLNIWYLKNVGYMPDKEPGGELVPIMELLNNVAGHLLLRYYEGE